MTINIAQKIKLRYSSRLMMLILYCCFFNSAIPQIHTGAETIKADEANAASKKYWLTNLDSSVYYAEQALRISLELNYQMGIAEAYRNMGVANRFIGDKNVAKQHLRKALTLFKSLPDKKGIAATYNNLGVLYTDLSDFTLSLNYLDSALVLFRSMSDKEGEGSVLNYIGINYQQQGNYQKAIDYCLQGFEVRKKINDHPGVVFSLINVGNMYLDVGQPQTALNFYNQSVTYAQDHNMAPVDYSLRQIGKTYLKLKQYDKARTYLIRKRNEQGMPVGDPLSIGELYSATGKPDSAIMQFKINLQQGNKDNKALSLAGLSKVSLMKGEYEVAISYAKQAYVIADSLKNKLILADVANVLAELYEINGEHKKALQFFQLAHSVTDSVSGENYQRKLAFTESNNEIENKQARIKLLMVEQELQKQKLEEEEFLKKLILLSFAIAIIIAFFIIRYINGKRKKIQSQRDQIELQRTHVEKAYSDLQSTQAQLIQREKMAGLGEMSAGIAHEIQNPLNFVNNFSEINAELIDEMRNELAGGNRQQAMLIAEGIKENEQKINHHGRRADAIVKNMLQHSRSSSSQKEPTNINTLCDEYLRLSYHGFRAKDKDFNATMKTKFDESIGKIEVVPQDIGRVLLNLYNNAFYALAEKSKQPLENYEPTISLATKKIGDKVSISVKDNGNGFPQKILDKVFQPFFTTKPAGQGTGLGLSLSYDIIKAHGGEIKVETTEGEGTEFFIQLPAV